MSTALNLFTFELNLPFENLIVKAKYNKILKFNHRKRNMQEIKTIINLPTTMYYGHTLLFLKWEKRDALILPSEKW